jgi:hypothetical protein
LRCPFRAADEVSDFFKGKTVRVVIDFRGWRILISTAELLRATSENTFPARPQARKACISVYRTERRAALSGLLSTARLA